MPTDDRRPAPRTTIDRSIDRRSRGNSIDVARFDARARSAPIDRRSIDRRWMRNPKRIGSARRARHGRRARELSARRGADDATRTRRRDATATRRRATATRDDARRRGNRSRAGSAARARRRGGGRRARATRCERRERRLTRRTIRGAGWIRGLGQGGRRERGAARG